MNDLIARIVELDWQERLTLVHWSVVSSTLAKVVSKLSKWENTG